MTFIRSRINYIEYFNNIRKQIVLIYIEGGIGVGKTTIINKYIEEHIQIKGVVHKIEEPIEEWTGNNFKNINMLDEMYLDKTKLALFQNYILNSHFLNMVKQIFLNKADIYIVERSIYSCRFVFTEMFYQNGDINNFEMVILNKQFEVFNNFNSLPDYIFNIVCDSKICIKRIQKRGRKGEEQITLDYLLKLRYYELLLLEKFNKIIEVLTIHNDTEDDSDFTDIKQNKPDVNISLEKYKITRSISF